jgi:hypothetical protein
MGMGHRGDENTLKLVKVMPYWMRNVPQRPVC